MNDLQIFFYFIKSLLIGIAIAAPVGPIGMLCIQKTLTSGFKAALLVGLGAALADSVYGLIAALGLSSISSFLLEKTVFIKIAGGLFLLYLAYKEIKNQSTSHTAQTKHQSSFLLVLDVFFLTLTNPMTILSFIGIFASLSQGPTNLGPSLMMVLGIFLGSMSWWMILGSIVVRIKHKLPEIWLSRLHFISAFILAGFGIMAIIGGVKNF